MYIICLHRENNKTITDTVTNFKKYKFLANFCYKFILKLWWETQFNPYKFWVEKVSKSLINHKNATTRTDIVTKSGIKSVSSVCLI